MHKKDFRKIIYLSDGKVSPTNIPFKISKSIASYSSYYDVLFFHLNLANIFNILRIVIKEFSKNRRIIIQSHHPKSLIFVIILRSLLKIFLIDNLLTFHTFLCELKRFTRIQLLIFKFSKYFIDEYCSVSQELSLTWSKFLKRKISFIKVGISKSEANIIKSKSFEVIKNKGKVSINNQFNIIWIGRLEKIKRPFFLLNIM